MNKPDIVMHALGECPYSDDVYDYYILYLGNVNSYICNGIGKWRADPLEEEVYNKIEYSYFCDGGYGERCLEV